MTMSECTLHGYSARPPSLEFLRKQTDRTFPVQEELKISFHKRDIQCQSHNDIKQDQQHNKCSNLAFFHLRCFIAIR